MPEDKWPNGTTIGVVFNVMYEQWSDDTAPGLGPMGNPLSGALDYQAISWAAYGRRVGVSHLLDLFREHGVTASFYVSGLLAERAPDTVARIYEDHHELCGHGYSQDVIPATLSRDAHAHDIARSLRAIEGVTGSRPTGWISPRCTPNADTAELLATEGVSWYGDVFDDDLPYLERTAGGPIVALPFGLDVNDLPMLVRYGLPARELATSFADVLAAHRRRGQKGYIDVTVHAHVAGRIGGLGALRTIVEQAVEATDCWVATRLEIASTVR